MIIANCNSEGSAKKMVDGIKRRFRNTCPEYYFDSRTDMYIVIMPDNEYNSEIDYFCHRLG